MKKEETDKEMEVKKEKKKIGKRRLGELSWKIGNESLKKRNEKQRKGKLDTRKWKRERRKRWKQRDKELENTLEREDMRDGGRGILILPGGRDLMDRKRRMKLMGGLRDR